MDQLDYVSERYSYDGRSYVEARIREGVMYGAFVEGEQVGFIGMHSEGSLGLLYVEEAYRRHGIARSLEAYMINRTLEKGWTPYGHVMVGNEDLLRSRRRWGCTAPTGRSGGWSGNRNGQYGVRKDVRNQVFPGILLLCCKWCFSSTDAELRNGRLTTALLRAILYLLE